MAPFPAVPAPQADAEQSPGRGGEDLWVATGAPRNGSRPGPGRPGAPASQPAPARPAVERRAVPPRPVEPRAVEPRAVEPRPVPPRPDLRAAAAAPFDLLAGSDRRAEPRAATPAVEESAPGTRPNDEDLAPWATGPAGRRVLPPAAAPSRTPASSAPPYGDWTKPSRSASTGESAVITGAPAGLDGLRPDIPPAPGTTAIPERNLAAAPDLDDDLDDRYLDDEYDDVEDADLRDRDLRDGDLRNGDLRNGHGDDRHDDDRLDHDRLEHDDLRDDEGRDGRPAPVDPATGEDLTSVTGTFGGRAALRAERQAAEAARRKSGRKGPAALGDEAPRRSPRRAVTALIAVAVVALGVLGVYSFASPKARETASTGTAPTQAAGPASGGDANALSDLPPLSTGPASPSASAPAAPIRLPVTVLNETTVGGLAAKISGAFKAGGWPTTNVGAYGNKDVAATTVFFTQGDENARQAALQLIAQFPQVQGPTPRFFDVPGNPTPGLVVVAAGEWKP